MKTSPSSPVIRTSPSTPSEKSQSLSLSNRSMLSEVIANESDSKRSVGVVRKPSSSRCARSTQSSVPPAASSPAASSARMLPRTTSRIRPAVQLVPVCGGVGLSAVIPAAS